MAYSNRKFNWDFDKLKRFRDKYVTDSIIKNGPAFDLSAYNAVGSTLATYADLSAALTALDALPAAYKKGGMSVKFVQSSDNKYVQARCLADEFTTDTTEWAICDDGTLVDNPDYIAVWTDKNKMLLIAIEKDGNFVFGAGVPNQIVDYIQEMLDEKVNKQEGKSLIDEEIAERVSYVEDSEHIEVKIDSQKNILESTKKDGKKTFVKGVEFDGLSLETKRNTDNLKMVVDGDGKVIDYMDKEGKNHLLYPTNQDDAIREDLDTLGLKVYQNSAAIVNAQEFNQVREDRCNNNVGYMFLSETMPLTMSKVIKNGKFTQDFTGRDTTAKIVLFGDPHFGNTIVGDFILSPTVEDRCGMAFENSNVHNGDFAMILGDLLDGPGNKEQVLEAQEVYYNKLKKLNIPCFPIEGNHDEEVVNKGYMKTNNLTKCGIIEFNGVRIICFNAIIHIMPDYPNPSVEDKGDVPDDVYEWLENAVKDSYNGGFLTILANHYELASDPNVPEWDETIGRHRDDIIELCRDYNVRLYINGHEHISGLIHKIVANNSITLDMMDVEFGRSAFSYSVMEIKNGEHGEGFYLTEYDSINNDTLHTLFIPMTNQASGTIYS